MDKMLEGGLPRRNAARSMWGLALEWLGRVMVWLIVTFWFGDTFWAIRAGHLSRIGVLVALGLFGATALAFLSGSVGKKRLEKIVYRIYGGAAIAAVLIASAVLLCPEKPDIHTWTPYQFDADRAALEAKHMVPDQDNAALPYACVFSCVNVADQPAFFFRDGSWFVRDDLAQHPWRTQDHPQASRWLDARAETIEKLLQMGPMKECRWPVHADVCKRSAIPINEVDRCARLMTAAGNRDFGEGRLSAAVEKYSCVLRMADHIYQQTECLKFEDGLRYETGALQMLRQVLMQSELSAGEVQDIARRLPAPTDAWRQECARLLEFERLRYLNYLAQAYEVDEEGRMRFSAAVPLSPAAKGQPRQAAKMPRVQRLGWLMTMPESPQGLYAMADAHFRRLEPLLLELAELPPPGRETKTPSDSWLHSLGTWSGNELQRTAEGLWFNGRDYVGLHRHYVAGLVQRRGTWLTLALRRYHEEQGQWPESLDSLSPYLPPTCFRDPVNGGEFVYARAGDNFTLYSTGANRIDEGGRGFYWATWADCGDDIPIWPPWMREKEKAASGKSK